MNKKCKFAVLVVFLVGQVSVDAMWRSLLPGFFTESPPAAVVGSARDEDVVVACAGAEVVLVNAR